MGAMAVLGVGLLYLLPISSGTLGQVHQMLHGTVDPSFGSGRVRIWDEVVHLIGQAPLLGGGPDTLVARMGFTFTRYSQETGAMIEAAVDVAHNDFLNIAVNLGLPALAFYMGGLACWLRGVVRHRPRAAGIILPGAAAYLVQICFTVRAGGNGASLYVYVQDGTMRLSAQQDACGIIADGEGATVGVVPINGDAVIQSGTTGARAYSLGSTEDAYGLLGNAFAVDADGQVTFSLREGLTEDAVGQSASAPIILSSDNYADSTADVVVNVVYEFVPVLDVEDISAVYAGEPIADTAIRGTAVYDGQTVEGTWSFKAGQNLTAVADSGPKTVVFTPADMAVYAQVEATVLVTIDKADPTGAPSYTAIKESGHTLADAALNVGTITPGGTIATTFAPNSGCTRGQVVTFLWRAASEPEPSSTVNPFTDVSADAYNYKAILWAYENGITGGTTATTFAPNATCTRAQVVIFLYRDMAQ